MTKTTNRPPRGPARGGTRAKPGRRSKLPPLAGLGFEPAAVGVVSRAGLTIGEAMAPGRVTVLRPVPRGGVPALFADPRMQGWHDLDLPVILAFQDAADAEAFERRPNGPAAPSATGPTP